MLAIFDLDETLIQGDSSQLFTKFLRNEAIDPSEEALLKDRDFMSDYQQGRLDLQAYTEFSLAPLQGWPQDLIDTLVSRLMDRVIAARVAPPVLDRVRCRSDQRSGLFVS